MDQALEIGMKGNGNPRIMADGSKAAKRERGYFTMVNGR